MKLVLALVPMSLPQKEAAQINMLEQIKPFSCINVEGELHRSIVNPGKCRDFMLQRKTP